MEFISRTDAKKLGLRFYFTGKPCVSGQIAERYVVNKECRCEFCKLKSANRLQNWQKNNVDKQLDQRRRYYEQNREQILSRNSSYQSTHREKLLRYRNQWLIQNPHLTRVYSSKRRASQRQRLPAWFGELDQLVAQEAADLARIRSEQTGFEWHVDHMVPLRSKKACGLHCAANLQVIPARINLAKNNRMLFTKDLEWLAAL